MGWQSVQYKISESFARIISLQLTIQGILSLQLTILFILSFFLSIIHSFFFCFFHSFILFLFLSFFCFIIYFVWIHTKTLSSDTITHFILFQCINGFPVFSPNWGNFVPNPASFPIGNKSESILEKYHKIWLDWNDYDEVLQLNNASQELESGFINH